MEREPSGTQCEFTDTACNRGGPDLNVCWDCPNRPRHCLVCGAAAPSWPFDLCPDCRRRGDKETVYQYYVRSKHLVGWLREVFNHRNIPYIISSRSFRLAVDLDGWVEATFKRMTGRRKLPSTRKPSRLYQLYRDRLLPLVTRGNRQSPKERREAWRWLWVHSPPEVRRVMSIYNTSYLWANFKRRPRSP